ncbi:MAG TPA: dienelactone hydrolase family protein [Stellaceae bacterium]|nr:dienelactone hydrolase family protein [Stellaceae bacterium]
MRTSEVTVRVGGGAMPLFIAAPDAPGPHPAVLVAHHRTGVDEFTRDVCERCAGIGVVAVAPNFYHRRPAGEDPVASMKELKDGELVDDINAAVRFLVSLPHVKKDAIGTVGHCLGGRTSYLGLVWNPIFKAAILLYHGNIFESRGEGMPAPFELTSNIRCPIIGFFGNDDRNPSPEMVRRLSREFARRGIRHVFHHYDGAGHAFQDHTSRHNYREAAAVDAWPKMLAFLDSALCRGDMFAAAAHSEGV